MKKTVTILLAAVLLLSLAACGGDGGGTAPTKEEVESWLLTEYYEDDIKFGSFVRLTEGRHKGKYLLLVSYTVDMNYEDCRVLDTVSKFNEEVRYANESLIDGLRRKRELLEYLIRSDLKYDNIAVDILVDCTDSEIRADTNYLSYEYRCLFLITENPSSDDIKNEILDLLWGYQ